MTTTVDRIELDAKIMTMYRAVAEEPDRQYHFEVGRDLAEHLGYPAAVLDRIPADAVRSFAGVGYLFDLLELAEGERVLDLGSGSGTDAFTAAVHVGPGGSVTGVDITPAQLAKSRRLAAEHGFDHVSFVAGRIEELPFPDAAFDVVMSNGVINLSTEKERVFAEAARVLRPGGRLAVADIVADTQLPERVVADSELWVSCIGGAAEQVGYQEMPEAAGLRVSLVRRNDYRFISDRAQRAGERYGVRSISLLARKDDGADAGPTP